MSRFLTLDDLEIAGRQVLLRVDFNVPMKEGRVTDTTRIARSLETIRELRAAGARIVLLSHFGRPKGARRPELSLAPVAAALRDLLDDPTVVFAEDCIGATALAAVGSLAPGGIALLENLRFHAGEEANDAAFAEALAALGDAYVNDAFSAAHRAHASVEALAHRLPSAAGRLMESELRHLSAALEAPERPLAAVIGGAKISTKLELLTNLVDKADLLAIGGGMANTFLNAQGIDVKASLCEHDMAGTAREILDRAAALGREVYLPEDARVARQLAPGTETRLVGLDAIAEGEMILDLGPASAAGLAERLAGCRTLVWNGPLGCFEVPPFDEATVSVAQAAARHTREGTLLSVAGGGDTLAALAHAGVMEDFSYVSTAGGAFLEWLEGKTLPGVAALEAAAGRSGQRA